jgi:hypothetical protein
MIVIRRRTPMGTQNLLRGIALAAALCVISVAARGHDEAKYPDWKGQWIRPGLGQGNAWDPTKPIGRGEEAPLTPEYQAIFEAGLADQAAGGQGTDPTYLCIPAGMPRGMIGILPMQYIITPETTYIYGELFHFFRRIYTDGRDWPKNLKHTYAGYSIGKWEDADGDGRFDTLAVETRGLKNPHSYDSSGIPFHKDERAVLMERIYSDPKDPNILRNDVTAIDNALTRPWSVQRSYRRLQKEAVWTEMHCSENNHHVVIGKENYVVSGDGFLMPARKNQAPPDLRYFDQGRKQ